MTRAIPLIAALLLAACAAATPAPDPFPPAGRTGDGERSLEVISSFLTGTFESIPQGSGGSGGDSSKVTLRTARPWKERTGEYWLYMEYEKAGEEGRPYLQRLVRIGEAGEWLAIIEYALPGEPRKLAGAWRNPAVAFAGIDPRTLRELPNCRQQVGVQNLVVFAGGTVGKACRAHVPEGAYELTEFSLSSATLRAWDRGYDASGKVVWGSAAGPLEMRRVAPAAR